MEAYHVVTERPMYIGQQILFDSNHHNGVYQRVMDKLHIVKEIYASPHHYSIDELEHHTAVALRELALEEFRQQKHPAYPSRMSCLYVSETMEEAEKWAAFFGQIGRPTYHIVRLQIDGGIFIGDATKCFRGSPDKASNLQLAEQYWEISQAPIVKEILADGTITVLEIVKEINANL